MPSRRWENVKISGIKWTWINLVVLKIFWFRESNTLTCLLRDSLGGGTKTSIITTIAPTSALKKSKPTLDIALKAMKVVNHPINPKRTKDDPYLFLPETVGNVPRPLFTVTYMYLNCNAAVNMTVFTGGRNLQSSIGLNVAPGQWFDSKLFFSLKN